MTGILAFNPEFVDLLDGDHLAALMLSQIIYWYRPAKGGTPKIQCFKNDSYWLVKSHKDWSDELRLTRFQSQRCLAKLKEKGLIETQVFRFNGSPMVHIRLSGLRGNRLPNDWEPALVCVETSNGLPENAQSLTETTTKTTTEITSSADKPRATKQQNQNPAEVLQGKPEGVVKKASQNDKEKAMATAAELVKKFQEKSKDATTNTKSGLCYLWLKRMNSLTGFPVPPLTQKDSGQLGHFLKKCGDESSRALDYALNNWSKFTWEVKTKKNFSTAPEVPIVGYVLAHADILLQLIAQKPEPVQFVQPVVAPKPKAEPKPVVVEDKPTEEQILADLAFLNSMGSK